MRGHRRALCLRAFVLVALALPCAPASALTTATFGTGEACTHPGTLKIAGRTITVDLSAVGKAAVQRAAFVPKRGVFGGEDKRVLEKLAVVCGVKVLALRAPRYRSFDATDAVRAALRAGSTLTLRIDALPGWDGRTARLEVTFAGKAKGKLPAVTALTARHRGGQTILTFREVDPPATDEQISVADLRAAKKKLAAAPGRITYRIYRSTTPGGPWRLIDEIGPLSCWNGEYHGIYPKKSAMAMRYVVADGAKPVPPGTGIYAHQPAEAGKAWYAVSVAVDGREDLDRLGEANTPGPVDETVGPGEPILQRVVKPDQFMYHGKPTLHYYVRWEAPPRCNVPSRPFDYLLAVPEKVAWPAAVNIAFPCWGASLNGGFGWWYGQPPHSALLISTNQIPYDWWTGYHEAMGTWRPWSAGVVRSYTQRRIDGFYDWVCGRFKVDRTRTFTGGNSMGGAGSLVYASHRPGKVAWTSSWVGVHIPAKTPHFLGSYEQCYGKLGWKLKHESGRTAFEQYDDAAWIRNDPAADLGLMTFGNGKDDGGIGWPQAVEYFRALQQARQPHVFHWALGGHGVRATLPGPGSSGSSMAIDMRTDQSLPAFARCSLDDDPGTGKLLAEPAEHRYTEGGGKVRVRKDGYDGDPQGHANRWLWWRTKDIVDEPGRWEMTVGLLSGAPAGECTVDVTPRRLQKLRAGAGQTFVWTNKGASGGKRLQGGEVKADKWGLVTLEGVRVGKGMNRLSVVRK
jgi:hypothetical protein